MKQSKRLVESLAVKKQIFNCINPNADNFPGNFEYIKRLTRFQIIVREH